VLRALWSARSVAIVGAGSRPGTPGRAVVGYLRRYGYAGRIVPVHPTATDIDGIPVWTSVQAYPGMVELALILVPAAAVPGAVADCVAAGVPVAIIGSSGFAETGPDGRAAQDAIVSAARAGGMRLVGPNCIGAYGVPAGLVASFSPMFSGPRLGTASADPGSEPDAHVAPGTAVDGVAENRRRGIGFASASGALGFGTVSLALDRDLPLIAAVSTGNEADVSALDVLAALAADPDCTALLGYVESLGDGVALRRLARAAAVRGVPVALLVAGASEQGAVAAASHTGALATGTRIVDGALAQLGIVRVSDVDDLLDAGDAFALVGGGGTGERIAVVTTSGGSGILAVDEVARAGLRLADLAAETVAELAGIVPAYGSARNPVDVTATVMNDRTLVRRALRAVAADPAVDAIVVCFCVLVGDDVGAIVDALAEARTEHGKPILVARTGADALAPEAAAALRRAGIPSYRTPARAIRAAAALHRATPRPLLATAATAPPPPVDHDVSFMIDGVSPDKLHDRRPEATEAVTEGALKAALAAAGVRVPRGRTVTSADDAVAAVADAGGRAVLKVVVPGLLHKTEAGGVRLGITPDRAAETYRDLARLPGATGVLVEEQVIGGVELLVGVASSPLGRILTIGAGGVLTEILDDAAVRLLPVDAGDVREMLAGTRAARLLAGVRGAPPADVDAFVRLVLAVAEVAERWPGDLDLNPVVVGDHDAIVLDAALTAPARPEES